MENTLSGLGHYHQPPGRHPTPIVIANGMQVVELVTYGRGWVRTQQDEWVEVLPGTLLWHVAGDQTIGRSDFENPYHCLAVRFACAGATGGRAGRPKTPPRPAPQITYWNDIETVRNFTNEVVSSYAMGKSSAAVVLAYILSRLHFQIELYLAQEKRQSIPPQLQRVIHHIDKHFGEGIRLGDLAAVAQWSVPQLHKSFREHLHQSPHQWVLARRIAVARERLANTDQPIKGIAADCGFYSAAAFCAHFKRATATTPNAYRKQMTQA